LLLPRAARLISTGFHGFATEANKPTPAPQGPDFSQIFETIRLVKSGNDAATDANNNPDSNKKQRFRPQKVVLADFKPFAEFTRKIVRCSFCNNGDEHIVYTNVELLLKYINDRGMIQPRRSTQCCARHQMVLSNAIKRSRQIGLMAFTSRCVLAFIALHCFSIKYLTFNICVFQ
jgi:small subunit ribosomal protein S18